MEGQKKLILRKLLDEIATQKSVIQFCKGSLFSTQLSHISKLSDQTEKDKLIELREETQKKLEKAEEELDKYNGYKDYIEGPNVNPAEVLLIKLELEEEDK